MFLAPTLQRLFFNFVKQSFLLILFFVSNTNRAQSFDTVDAIALKYPTNISNATDLANRIEQDFTADEQKVRALYVYLTNTIAYNLNEYKYGVDRYSFSYSSQEELQQKIRTRNLEIITQTLVTKRAICEGYSMTFKEVCDLMHIQCVVISGYTRTAFSTIGKLPLEGRHAWNAVYINSKWNLIDTTWGAGYSSDANHWISSYDAYFFFTEPRHLIRTHFPETSRWQLLKAPLSKVQFTNQPLYSSLFFKEKLELLSPKSGILSSRKEFLIVTLKNAKPDLEFGYAFENDYYLTTVIPEFQNSISTLKIPLKGKENTKLNLLVDGEMILQYQLK